MNRHKKFMSENKLKDALLKEFVGKGLWRPAIEACEEAINARKADILKLVELKLALQEEVGDGPET
jgi:hypothetical protein